AAGSATQVTTTSEASASARGVGATGSSRPRRRARSGDRFQTVTGHPLRARLRAMPAPMIPSPATPTRRRGASLDGRSLTSATVLSDLAALPGPLQDRRGRRRAAFQELGLLAQLRQISLEDLGELPPGPQEARPHRARPQLQMNGDIAVRPLRDEAQLQH